MEIQSRRVPHCAAEKGQFGSVSERREEQEEKSHKKWTNRGTVPNGVALVLISLALSFGYLTIWFQLPSFLRLEWDPPLAPFILEGIEQCKIIQRPPPHFEPSDEKRIFSDRFVRGTRPTLLINGTVWTGFEDGTEIKYSHDIYLDGGVVRALGSQKHVQKYMVSEGLSSEDYDTVDLHGAWVTPGIVDMHSHAGVESSPVLEGSSDGNSEKGPILPWLRSLDGFNTHDATFNLSIAGGVTTMLVLPGSAGNIGGTAYTFKPRWTQQNTAMSMQVEPPFILRQGAYERTKAWRHIKHATGENPHRVYHNTRMDTAYDFRRAYTEGKNLKERQDRWCASPRTQAEPLPQSLEWESLADVIRGNVKVNIHCYEAIDFDAMIRLSNEFKFHIAAFHHAHEAYLIPDLLKEAYGGAPSVAMFANFARYKREAFRHSELAPKILADAGIDVVMKSDHPNIDSRYLVFEAAQAHAHGLNFSQALSSIITTPARSIGLDHRLGFLKVGYDADMVVWDSFPLALGATPKQTYIDGIPQIVTSHQVIKPASAHEIFEVEADQELLKNTLATRGEPDLRPKKSVKSILFHNVSEIYFPRPASKIETQSLVNGTVVVENGDIVCVGQCDMTPPSEFETINLHGGSVTPGYVTFGSTMGMAEISQEAITSDGEGLDSIKSSEHHLNGLVDRAVDGLHFGTTDAFLAYRAGITTAVAFPLSSHLVPGLSCAFSPGAENVLSLGAVINPSGALHVHLDNSQMSISSNLAILRDFLTYEPKDGERVSELELEFQAVKEGRRRLVVGVERADLMGRLIELKREFAPRAKMTIVGATEAWMIADELAENDIGVIVTRARSFPETWGERRIMPGLPLSKHSLVSFLVSRGVMVGLGTRTFEGGWEAHVARLEAGWQYANYPHVFDRQQAIDLISRNIEELLGLNDDANVRGEKQRGSWVAWDGDALTFRGQAKGVKRHGVNSVDLF